MKNKLLIIFRIIYRLKDKIAFFPSIIAIGGCVFAYLMFFLEEKGISKYLLDIIPELVINNTETARSILTTFIAGLISIMVFSFSMVMILLNQASSNFSPRLLPGLISNRKHQIILGIYIATILYCIFILVSIEPNEGQQELPGFSVLMAIFLMVNCLAAFIYFIHSISEGIQINNIMDKIFLDSKKKLEHLINNDKEIQFPNTENWISYKSNKAGYLESISFNAIAEIAKKNDCKIEILAIKGLFINTESPLFKTEKELDEAIISTLHRHFDFDKNELIEENYVLAFKQITEIAIKAMSPALNDPGTALNAIDYLTQLFALRLQKNETSYVCIEDNAWVLLATIDFKTLIYQVMVAFRTYCKHDAITVQKLLLMLNYLHKLAKNNNEDYRKIIEHEIENLKIDAKEVIKNERDLTLINSI